MRGRFTVYKASLSSRVVCNGYEHYPSIAPLLQSIDGADPDLLFAPMNVDVSEMLEHSLEYALQLPNQVFPFSWGGGGQDVIFS